MAKPAPNTGLKRLRNRYRMVVMNEDTYEEVVKFKLSRWSVYALLSAVFLIMVGITAALITFSPLKYYLPGAGYGDAKQVNELKQLKIRADSIEKALHQNQQYMNNIQQILQGKMVPKDTTVLKVKKNKKNKF
ncbi:MAG TPA: hypothetical protein PLE75_08955 [Ferruginibacter sp.]|nr:hypothetical protein [Chitinophagaceae bacterium]HML58739.1 hypothetical protein [Ferruginibacter sp.]HRN92626.1 hypothetical protein [Ferruginibacter sp.]HRO06799.1 hypothetical protein [Ferruginibacter sp.]HRO97129.1 hypothetical protein [Ferruginibacter sp.]